LTVLSCPVKLREKPPGGCPSCQAALAPQLQHPFLTGAGTETSWRDLPCVGAPWRRHELLQSSGHSNWLQKFQNLVIAYCTSGSGEHQRMI